MASNEQTKKDRKCDLILLTDDYHAHYVHTLKFYSISKNLDIQAVAHINHHVASNQSQPHSVAH